MTPARPSRSTQTRTAGSPFVDVLVFASILAGFAGLLMVSRQFLAQPGGAAQISTNPSVLPLYSLFSLLRVIAAYGLSLAFTLVYGYIAAYNKRAGKIMVPLLDILQSIPVLSFLPGVMLALVSLIPHGQLGVEIGAILLIFTGQVWNMAFSFYSSLKNIPRELKEAARIHRFSWWQRFTQLELPYAVIGLVMNSMMSVAGGWFFLMACEMFVLNKRDFRLPGLGSYLQTAAGHGDMVAICWGIFAMISVIFLLDTLVWRPVLSWANKFKLEQVESSTSDRPIVLDIIRRSRILSFLGKRLIAPMEERITHLFLIRENRPAPSAAVSGARIWLIRLAGIAALGMLAVATGRALGLLGSLTLADAGQILKGAGATFLRVNLSLLISALWTIPVGVAIGLNPRLGRIAQPIAQIAASVPATALFPVVLLILIQMGGGMEVASIALMMLGTQWYLLFNVIAGALAIPSDLRETARTFRFTRFDWWRCLVLPGIFPYLVTGFLTAAGGAWNASIVAEYFSFRNQTLSTGYGLGATISRATADSNYGLLLAATIVMAGLVVTVNRLVWRRLYNLAETRFRLDH